MLAENLADRFGEWLAEQTQTHEWSLRGALRQWLYDEATSWTAEDYGIYLRTVIAIMVAWVEDPAQFVYHLHDGAEVAIASMSEGESPYDESWDFMEGEQYRRAAYMSRESTQAQVRS